jgi:uncharacterized protein (TIGR02611 family)
MSRLHSPIEWLKWIGRNAKRLFIFIIGVAVLAAGVAMLALPGPGILVIIAGLAILGTEFAWAERALDKTASRAAGAASKVQATATGKAAFFASGIGMTIVGIVVIVAFPDYRAFGVSFTAAGLIALATLHPRAQAWIAEKSQPVAPTAADAPEQPTAG